MKFSTQIINNLVVIFTNIRVNASNVILLRLLKYVRILALITTERVLISPRATYCVINEF